MSMARPSPAETSPEPDDGVPRSGPPAPAGARDARRTASMTTLLAWRNLRHDPVRFGATLVGVVFSVTLMTIQHEVVAAA